MSAEERERMFKVNHTYYAKTYGVRNGGAMTRKRNSQPGAKTKEAKQRSKGPSEMTDNQSPE